MTGSTTKKCTHFFSDCFPFFSLFKKRSQTPENSVAAPTLTMSFNELYEPLLPGSIGDSTENGRKHSP